MRSCTPVYIEKALTQFRKNSPNGHRPIVIFATSLIRGIELNSTACLSNRNLYSVQFKKSLLTANTKGAVVIWQASAFALRPRLEINC